MARIKGKVNLEFLIGMVSAYENRLLRPEQLELLEELKDISELDGLISGSAFHSLFKDFLNTGQIESVYLNSGALIRQFMLLEPPFVLLAFLNRVAEAYQLLWLNPDIADDRLFGCGLYAYELRLKENMMAPELIMLKRWLLPLKESALSSGSLDELEQRIFAARRTISLDIAALYGEPFRDFLQSLNLIEDCGFVVAALKFDRKVPGENSELFKTVEASLREFLVKEFESRDEIFAGFLSLKYSNPDLYNYLNFLWGAEDLSGLYLRVEKLKEKLYLKAKADRVSPFYPFVYFQLFSRQLEKIIDAYVKLNLTDLKEVALRK